MSIDLGQTGFDPHDPEIEAEFAGARAKSVVFDLREAVAKRRGADPTDELGWDEPVPQDEGDSGFKRYRLNQWTPLQATHQTHQRNQAVLRTVHGSPFLLARYLGY